MNFNIRSIIRVLEAVVLTWRHLEAGQLHCVSLALALALALKVNSFTFV